MKLLQIVRLSFYTLVLALFFGGCASDIASNTKAPRLCVQAVVPFGAVQVGRSAEYPLLVRSCGTDLLQVYSQLFQDSIFTIDSSIDNAFSLGALDSHVVRILFKPKDTITYVRFDSILSSAGTIKVTLLGEGTATQPIPCLSVPGPINFGSITIGRDTNIPVPFVNCGNSIVMMQPPEFSVNDFSLKDSSLFQRSIGTGDTEWVTIRFAPTLATPINGKVTITSNAVTRTINLSGTGIRATRILQLTDPVDCGNAVVGLCDNNSLGTPRSLTIAVTNNGNDALRVDSIVTTPPGIFRCSIRNVVVPPSSTDSFIFLFCPAKLGSVVGRLTVFSNATSGNRTATLTGCGAWNSPGLGSTWQELVRYFIIGDPNGSARIESSVIKTHASFLGTSDATQWSAGSDNSNYAAVQNCSKLRVYSMPDTLGGTTFLSGRVVNRYWITLPDSLSPFDTIFYLPGDTLQVHDIVVDSGAVTLSPTTSPIAPLLVDTRRISRTRLITYFGRPIYFELERSYYTPEFGFVRVASESFAGPLVGAPPGQVPDRHVRTLVKYDFR